ncbi:MAG: sulfatase [Flavobacteriales bacterium]|nr:sulfatase [Flavobacteriales bacterium]
MKIRFNNYWTALCCILTILLIIASCSTEQTKSKALPEKPEAKPNILFIMIDDLGWMDLAYQGATDYHTPNIDKLAKQGMIFTDAYAAAPVCSPTRAAAMTGLAPARLKITNHIPDRWSFYNGKEMGPGKSVNQLEPKYNTVAERLRAAGYATGFIGKWHMAGADHNALKEEYLPMNHGFDINIGGTSMGGPGGDSSYFDPFTIPTLENKKEGQYLPDRLADEAIDYMTKQKDTDNPFFLCLWNYTVHWPVEAPGELVGKYAPDGDANLHQKFQAMVEGMDMAIGRVLKSLDDLGIAENTLVVLTSDNGPFTGDIVGEITTVNPLKDEKGYLSEGGIRVPLIIRWPNKIESGTVSNEPVITMDFVPTFLDAADHKYEAVELDGESLLPLLTENKDLNRTSIYFHYPHYAFHSLNKMGSAVRKGDYKLLYYHVTEEVELYDLKIDIGETTNLAEEKPEIAKELLADLKAWLVETDAEMPRRTADIKDDELVGKIN